jgi:hypothetical protein
MQYCFLDDIFNAPMAVKTWTTIHIPQCTRATWAKIHSQAETERKKAKKGETVGVAGAMQLYSSSPPRAQSSPLTKQHRV